MKRIYTVFYFLLLSVFSVHAQEVRHMQHVLISKGEVTIAGKTKGFVTKDELLNAGSLELRQKFKPIYTIARFRMVIRPKEKGVSKVFENLQGAELSPEMADAIKAAGEGDKIFFERILCTD